MQAMTQAVAKRDFIPICRRVSRDGKREYVRDKAGECYLTFDHKERKGTGPSVPVGAQFFRENFSRFSSLLRVGLSFRVTTTRPSCVVFVRRHTDYDAPLDGIVAAWRVLVAERAAEGDLSKAVRRLEHKVDAGDGEVLDAVRALAMGVARFAIGHRPFEEGQASMDEVPPPLTASAVRSIMRTARSDLPRTAPAPSGPPEPGAS